MRIRHLIAFLTSWVVAGCSSFLSAAQPDTLRGLRAVAPDTRPEEKHGFYRESWAVVIGINDYEHWPKLTNAVNDAKGMEQSMIDVLKIPKDHIITLYDREATKDHIQRVLGDELADPAKVQKDDRILIFYAGHGGNRQLPDGRYRGYLIPVEADLEHLESTAIPMKDLTEWAEAIPAKHIYYVLDACYSGLAMTRGGAPLKGGARAFIERVVSRDARKILTAGGKDEQVADGGPRGHSVFTGNFLVALEGAGDTDGDGVVTASEVGQYVMKNVSAQARQTPAYGNLPGDQGGEVILNVLEGVSPTYTETAPATSPAASAKQTGAIRVVTTPEKATVTLDGAYKGETPLVVGDLLTGTYVIAIQLGGYTGITRSVVVSAGETYGMEVGLTPETGGLIVTSKPAGAEVMLDGVSRGVTSSTGLKVDGLKSGVYRLTVRRESYEDYGDDIVVERQQTMKVAATLMPQAGRMSITSMPTGTTVLVDGVEKGLTPVETPGLSSGAHRVQLQRTGYDPVDEQVTVESNRTVSRSYALHQTSVATSLDGSTTHLIDWTSQTIRATGMAAPNPKLPLAAQKATTVRAAQVIALRNALEALKGVKVSSETTVENAMLQSDVITTELKNVVTNNFRVTDTRYYSDGTVEVDVEMAINEGFRDLIMPQAPGTPSRPPVSPSGAEGGRYTGLIVDARGLGVQPAMAPKIVDERGDEIYGTSLVGRDYAVKIGVVGYERDLTRAMTNERVANHPLIVKGTKASGRNRGDVVVSDFDAKAIRELAQTLKFLSECRVMVVVD